MVYCQFGFLGINVIEREGGTFRNRAMERRNECWN